jgi:hypothetical protein
VNILCGLDITMKSSLLMIGKTYSRKIIINQNIFIIDIVGFLILIPFSKMAKYKYFDELGTF